MNTRKETLLNDIVALGISASPYATETLAESPMYTWVDLISSIGGQTGYLLSIIFEILFSIYRTLDWRQFNKFC
jgi:hypothetical protein